MVEFKEDPDLALAYDDLYAARKEYDSMNERAKKAWTPFIDMLYRSMSIFTPLVSIEVDSLIVYIWARGGSIAIYLEHPTKDSEPIFRCFCDVSEHGLDFSFPFRVMDYKYESLYKGIHQELGRLRRIKIAKISEELRLKTVETQVIAFDEY